MTTATTTQILHLFAPISGLALMSSSHAILSRFRPAAPILNMLVLSGLCGLIALIVVEVGIGLSGAGWGETVFQGLAVDSPIYACLAYGYANFVNLGHASVRLRIYRELLASPSGIPLSELHSRYGEEGMLETRLARLVEANDLAVEGSHYRLQKRRLLYVALTIFTLKKAVLGRASEFEP